MATLIGFQGQVTSGLFTPPFHHLDKKDSEGQSEVEIAVFQILSMGVVPLATTMVEEVLEGFVINFREQEISLEIEVTGIPSANILDCTGGEEAHSLPSDLPLFHVDSTPQIEEIQSGNSFDKIKEVKGRSDKRPEQVPSQMRELLFEDKSSWTMIQFLLAEYVLNQSWEARGSSLSSGAGEAECPEIDLSEPSQTQNEPSWTEVKRVVTDHMKSLFFEV